MPYLVAVVLMSLVAVAPSGCGTAPGAGACPAGQVATEAGCAPDAVVADGGGFGEGGGESDAGASSVDTGASEDAASDAGPPPTDTAGPDADPSDAAGPDADTFDGGSSDTDPFDGGSPDADPFDVGPPDSGVDAPVCIPDCDGRSCGPDGCGGVCGVCDPDAICTDGGACEPVDPPAGDASCLEVAECVFDCDDEACADACFGEGTLAAQREFDELVACADARCDAPFGSEDWIDCVFDVCPASDTCFDGPPIEPECSPADRVAATSLGGRAADDVLDCGFDCLDELGETVCARECTAEVLGIAESCAVCTGELVLCAADDCDEACGGRGGYDRDCRSCLRDEGCQSDFDACLGSVLPFP